MTESLSIRKTITKATNFLTGTALPPHKQLRYAILDGNEEKAIEIYLGKDAPDSSVGAKKALIQTLLPSQPFPSKKKTSLSPLVMAAKYGMPKLFCRFLENGGDPLVLNEVHETCIHAATSQIDLNSSSGDDQDEISLPSNSKQITGSFSNSFDSKSVQRRKGEIIDHIVKWIKNEKEYTPHEDLPHFLSLQNKDGNTGVHFAAQHGFVNCLEKLAVHGAILSIMNRSQKCCVDLADSAGFRDIATMLELALLFSSTSSAFMPEYSKGRKSTDHHQTLSRVKGKLFVDSVSVSRAGLVEFISQTTAIAAKLLSEQYSRAEVLLWKFSWNLQKLFEDSRSNLESVYSAANLQPPEGLSKDRHFNRQPLNTGVTLSELYFDPDYSEEMRQAFTVFRGGKKFSYGLKMLDGVPCLQQVDRSVSNMSSISEESVDDPKTTYPCRNCEELMYEAASPRQHAKFAKNNHQLSNANHREVHCPSGHVFCFQCWRDRLHTQLLDANNHMGMLFCLSPNCGEALDLQWAPAIFDTPDLLERFNNQRVAGVAESLQLKRCPRGDCDMFVHLCRQEAEQSSSESSNESKQVDPESLPQTASCRNGHTLCTICFDEGHSPLLCEDVSIWKDYVVRNRNSFAGNPTVVTFLNNVLSKMKKCPSCSAEMRKEDPCNKIRCENCNHTICWTCMQSWDLHAENSSSDFKCNKFVVSPKEGDGAGENIPNSSFVGISVGPNRILKTILSDQQLFLHYYIRFQIHSESLKVETSRRHEIFARIESAIQQTKDGQLAWLLGTSTPQPYQQASGKGNAKERRSPGAVPHGFQSRALMKQRNTDIYSPDKDSISKEESRYLLAIADFYLLPEKSLEFLSDAYDELERCRSLLRWSYPLCLFDVEDVLRHPKSVKGFHKFPFLASDTSMGRLDGYGSNSSDNSARATMSGRLYFYALQTILEYRTEQLSDLLCRPRIRFSKEQLKQAVKDANDCRVDLEAILDKGEASNDKNNAHFHSLSIDAMSSSRETVTEPRRVPGRTNRNADAEAALSSSPGSRVASSNFYHPKLVKPSSPSSSSDALPFPPLSTDSNNNSSGSRSSDKVTQHRRSISLSAGHYRAASLDSVMNVTTAESISSGISTSKAKDEMAIVSPSRLKSIHSFSHFINPSMRIDEGEVENAIAFELGSVNPMATKRNTPPLGSSSSSSNLNSPIVEHNVPLGNSKGNSSKASSSNNMNMSNNNILDTSLSRQVFRAGSMSHNASTSSMGNGNNSNTHTSVTYGDSLFGEKDRALMALSDNRNADSVPIYSASLPQERFRGTQAGSAGFQAHDVEHSDRDSPLTFVIAAKKDPDQEALEHGMLLSQQEAEYGVNMYDALTEDDEPRIEEYIKKGFSREEAILLLFEEKIGKVSTQSKTVVPAMPTLLKTVSNKVHAKSKSNVEELKFKVVEPPTLQQIISRGYTPEQATQLYEHEKKRSISQNANAGFPPPPIGQQRAYHLPVASGHDYAGQNFNPTMSPLYQHHIAPTSYHLRRASNSGLSMQSSIISRHSADTAPLSHEETTEIQLLLSRGHSWEAAQQIIINNRNISSTASIGASSSISSLTGNSSRYYSMPQVADASVYSRSIALNSGDNSVSNSTVSNMGTSPKLGREIDDDIIQTLFAKGYSKEQVFQLRGHQRFNSQGVPLQLINTNKPPPVFDEAAIHILVSRGHTLEKAKEIYLQKMKSDVQNLSSPAQSSLQQSLYTLRGGLNNGNRSESSSSYHSDQNAVKSSKALAVAQQDPSSSHGEYYPHNLHRTQAANTATLQKQPGFAQDVLQDLSHVQRSFGSSGQLQPQLHPNAPSNSIDSQSTRKMWIESRKTVDQQFSDIQKRLSQQEREYDINMYDSLTPADEPELQSLQNMGHSREDAVCIIFENRIKNNVTSSNIPSNSLGAPAPSTQSVPQRAVLPSSGPYVGNYNPMSSSNMAAAASSGAESYGFASNSSPPAHYHHNQSRQYHQLQQPQQQQQQHGAAVYTNAGIPLTRLSPHSSPQYFQQSQLLSIPPMNTPVGISRTLPLPHPGHVRTASTDRYYQQAQYHNIPPGYASNNSSPSSSTFHTTNSSNSSRYHHTISKMSGGNNHIASMHRHSDVEQLINLGFSAEQATRALMECQNDVNLAANKLFSQ